MKKKQKSIVRQLGIQSAFIAVIAIGALLVSTFYNLYLFARETRMRNEYFLGQFIYDVESEMKVFGLLMSNTVVEYAVMLQQKDTDKRYFVNNEMMKQLDFMTPVMHYIDGCFYASPLDETILFCMNSSLKYKTPQDIKGYVYQYGDREDNISNWEFLEIQGSPYLLYSSIYNGIYFGVWCDVERLLRQISADMPEECVISAHSLQQQFQMEAEKGKIQENELKDGPGKLAVSLFLPQKSTDFYLRVSTPTFFYSYAKFSVLLIVLSLGGILILLLNVWWTRKRILVPVNKTVEAFGKVAEGNLEVRMDFSAFSSEFQKIGRAFNEMVSQIGRMKIEQYTQKIERQNVELQYYQMQVEPHFYLNTLNTIYSMAQIGENSAIQEICRYLSKYMRYMFSRKDFHETVEEALENLKNYLQLQRLRNAREIQCYIDIPSELMRVRIPVFLLHTFVENSVKYAHLGTDQKLMIQITGSLTQNRVEFVIGDNGEGYGEGILREFQDKSYWQKENMHVGIRNVYQRMRYLYSGEMGIEIWNEEGAHTRIYFQPDEGERNESIDRR